MLLLLVFVIFSVKRGPFNSIAVGNSGDSNSSEKLFLSEGMRITLTVVIFNSKFHLVRGHLCCCGLFHTLNLFPFFQGWENSEILILFTLCIKH